MAEGLPLESDGYEESASVYKKLVTTSALSEITSKLRASHIDHGQIKAIISDIIINYVRLSIQRIEGTIQQRTRDMMESPDYPLLELSDKGVRLFSRISKFEERALAWKSDIDAGLHLDEDFNAGLLMAEEISARKEQLTEISRIQGLSRELVQHARDEDDRVAAENGKKINREENRAARAGQTLSDQMGPVEEMVERFLRSFLANPTQATESLCDGQIFSQIRLKRAGDNLSSEQAFRIYGEIESFKKSECFQTMARQAESMCSLFVAFSSNGDDAKDQKRGLFQAAHDWWSDGSRFEDYLDRTIAADMRTNLKEIRSKLNELAQKSGKNSFNLPSELTTLLLEIQQDYYDLNDKDHSVPSISEMMDAASRISVGQTVAVQKLTADHIRGFAHTVGEVAKLFPMSQKIMGLVDPEEDPGSMPAPFLYHAAFRNQTGSVLSRALVGEGKSMREYATEVVLEDLGAARGAARAERVENARSLFRNFKATTRAYALLLQRNDDEFTRDVLNAMRWEVIGSSQSPGVPVVAGELFLQGKFAIPERSLKNLQEQFHDGEERTSLKRQVLIRGKLTEIMLHVLANVLNLEMFEEAFSYFVPEDEPADKRAKARQQFLRRLEETVVRDPQEAAEEYLKRSEAMKDLVRMFSITLGRPKVSSGAKAASKTSARKSSR